MDDVIGKHLVMLAVVRMDCTLDNVEPNLASIAARFHSTAVSPCLNLAGHAVDSARDVG